MSKSRRNIITLENPYFAGTGPVAFKLAILSKHYQTEGNFTWEILEAAQARLNHWRDYAVQDIRLTTHWRMTIMGRAGRFGFVASGTSSAGREIEQWCRILRARWH